MKQWLSVYHSGMEALTTFAEMFSILGCFLLASSIIGDDNAPQISVWYLVLIPILVLSVLLLYQNWFCERVHKGVLVKSNWWSNPAPGIFFIYFCLSPILLSLLAEVAEININNIPQMQKDVLGVFFVIQFLAWITWVQMIRNNTRDFLEKTEEMDV